MTGLHQARQNSLACRQARAAARFETAVDMISEGVSMREVSRRMNLSYSTIRRYMRMLRHKMGEEQ